MTGPPAGLETQPDLERRRATTRRSGRSRHGSLSRPGSSPVSAWSDRSPEITQLSPVEAAPRHLQAVELFDYEVDQRATSVYPMADRIDGNCLAPSDAAPQHLRGHHGPGALTTAGRARQHRATYSAGVLHLHRSERADGLVAMLAELVAEPLDDALTRRGRGRPDPGVERWLTQRLSHHLGASPGAPRRRVRQRRLPVSRRRWSARPWRWPAGIDPRRPVVARSARSGRCSRWSTRASTSRGWRRWPHHLHNSAPEAESGASPSVRHVADLYDRYGVHRPAMLQAWANGGRRRIAEPPGGRPSCGAACEAASGCPARPSGWSRPASACGTSRRCSSLPPRLSLFGLTRLPASYLDVLDAIAAGRDVHLFLLHPSPALWDQRRGPCVGPTRASCRAARTRPPARRSNPLLASWGRDAREMQLVLGATAVEPRAITAVAIDERPRRRRSCSRLQADVRVDRAPAGAAGPAATDEHGRCSTPTTAASRSTRATAGPARSRCSATPILHLLEEDPTLEPRDVIVMCPDIENFAPLIQATFGSSRPGRTTARRVARRSGSAWPTGRSARPTRSWASWPSCSIWRRLAVTATEVLDLAGREPVRRRFRFDDDDLSRIEEWVGGAGVRWGLDAEHRTPFKLGRCSRPTPGTPGSTGRCSGVAMAEERQRLFGGACPSTTWTAATSTWPGAGRVPRPAAGRRSAA